MGIASASARAAAIAGMTACTLMLGGCATTPEEDPVQIKLNDVDRRLERLERVLANQSLLELAQQVQTLQADVRSVHGELEKSQHTTDTSKDQQRNLYGDLDRRLQALERGGVGLAPSSPTGDAGLAPAPIAPGVSDRASYQAAFELLKNGKHEQATAAFQQFIATFPNSPLVGNAQYWLGQSYYVTQNFSEALKAFRTVIDRYSSSGKAPDAWLKIGLTQYELKAWGPAREALNRAKTDFPGTPAAEEAGRKLEKMAAEGH